VCNAYYWQKIQPHNALKQKGQFLEASELIPYRADLPYEPGNVQHIFYSRWEAENAQKL
jgi:hypothetical protein